MEVYLVPVGQEAYEPYCETPDEPEDEIEPVRPVGRWWWLNVKYWFRRLKYRFHVTLAEAERERRRGAAVATGGSWWQRLRRRSVRWVAESIAEQRLLWNLRRETAAEFFYPDDMREEDAVATLRRQLTRDFEKHRLWLAIDSLLLVGPGSHFWLAGAELPRLLLRFPGGRALLLRPRSEERPRPDPVELPSKRAAVGVADRARPRSGRPFAPGRGCRRAAAPGPPRDVLPARGRLVSFHILTLVDTHRAC